MQKLKASVKRSAVCVNVRHRAKRIAPILQTNAVEYFNPDSVQTGPESAWQSGRLVDMGAFDQLPSRIRDWLNEHLSFFPVEDVLHEYQHEHGRNADATIEWLKEYENAEPV